MRKDILIIFTIILSLFVSSCNCKKNNIEYKYVGVYVELIDVETPSMDDRNPKLYYNETTKNVVDTKQIYEYQLSTASINKNIYQDGEVMIYDLACLYQLNVPYDTKLDEVKLYLIIYDGINYKVSEKNKTLKLENNETSTVSFKYSYSYNDEEYGFKTTIKIHKKEM